MKTELFPIPTWVLGYLINGDETNLEPSEVEMIKEWIYDNEILNVICPDNVDADLYFDPFPPFGLACDVVDCECVLHW